MPQELLAEIREFGGNMKETYGVPVEEIQEAIKYGVRKINIDTDIRLAMTGAIRRFFAENPEKFDPREYTRVSTSTDSIAFDIILSPICDSVVDAALSDCHSQPYRHALTGTLRKIRATGPYHRNSAHRPRRATAPTT
ncbi:class II fructose-bisphosphate aldolase [Lactiplantibacillus plantarum]|uniref:class II fructose-bisphosphate aldolase n=1 Tax=Lactiplantibacillus plantarum TaxID=1590 RepID=UPI0040466A88